MQQEGGGGDYTRRLKTLVFLNYPLRGDSPPTSSLGTELDVRGESGHTGPSGGYLRWSATGRATVLMGSRNLALQKGESTGSEKANTERQVASEREGPGRSESQAGDSLL